jgi:hypothetical protein
MGLALLLSACAAPPPPARSDALSRDARSQNYCARIGGVGTEYYDPGKLLICRREEYTASAALVSTAPVPRDIDARCDGEASFGNAPLYFSWVAYFDCVNESAPMP